MPTSSYSAATALEPAREASPFIKWAGGKARLLSQLLPLLPAGVDKMRHVEPFLGGGAMFFARRPKRALLCDINQALIGTYQLVRDRAEDVIAHLGRLADGHSAEGYYDVREHYNAGRGDDAERAAMFVYLNKTCFNGLYRVNRKGRFNVPAGRYAKPRILDSGTLLAASHVLRNADVRCSGFEDLLKLARPGDFIYLDPPYEPVSRTASFTAYARDGFRQADQERLRDVFVTLDGRGCKLMLSNSDVPFTRELYRSFQVDQVAAARAINSNARGRGIVSEIVVRNYT